MKTEYEVFVEELMEALRKMAGYTEKQVYFARKGSKLAKTGDRILVESAAYDDGVEMCSVYVGEMYERYQKGEDIYRISGEILGEIRKIQNSSLFEGTRKLARYETARPELFIRLLNFEHNEADLQNAVYRRFGEIALVLYLKVLERDGCLTSLKIRQEYLESWGEDEDSVFEDALKNTMAIAPPRIYFWHKLIGNNEYEGEEVMTEEETSCLRGDVLGNCLSTSRRTNGAVAIFLPGVAKHLAEALGGDLYLAFTSVHEVMVHNACQADPKGLEKALKSTIRDATPEEDYLSSCIYRYSQKEQEFSCVTKPEVPTYSNKE
jgi:hypothetical protein